MDIDHFMRKVSPEPNSGCWLWDGYVENTGYGRHGSGRNRTQAHRLSWVLHNGRIPIGRVVCHRCDMPACVNPDHLFLGSPADNARDMVAKDRHARGSRNARASLTEDQAREILTSPERNCDIARRMNVPSWTVARIRARETWKHVEGQRIVPRKRRLDRDDAAHIKRSSLSGPALADMYGVSVSAIYAVKRGQNWKYL